MVHQIIIEVNTAMPSFEGLHDITMTELPPRRKPYLIMAPEDRIGLPYIPVDPEKVVAIIESDYPDQTQPNAPEDETSRAIANNLIEFLKHEVSRGRLPANLLPIQSGIGNIANAVIGGLAHGEHFTGLKVWTEVLQGLFILLYCKPRLMRIPLRTPSWTCSIVAIWTLLPQHLFVSLQRALNAFTTAGRIMRARSCCVPSKSPTRQKSFAGWGSSA